MCISAAYHTTPTMRSSYDAMRDGRVVGSCRKVWKHARTTLVKSCHSKNCTICAIKHEFIITLRNILRMNRISSFFAHIAHIYISRHALAGRAVVAILSFIACICTICNALHLIHTHLIATPTPYVRGCKYDCVMCRWSCDDADLSHSPTLPAPLLELPGG